jgi:hypothetical protein
MNCVRSSVNRACRFLRAKFCSGRLRHDSRPALIDAIPSRRWRHSQADSLKGPHS